MDLDFKGTWKCRNGKNAQVESLTGDIWKGDIDEDGDGNMWFHSWDSQGKSTENNEWDLMENISVKWSSERASTGCP